MTEQKKGQIGRVEVDRARCFAHERCVAIAPEVFALDEEAISTVGDIAKADDDTLRQAAAACPMEAIFVYDGDGNQIYPEAIEW
jgi:ferredoxin